MRAPYGLTAALLLFINAPIALCAQEGTHWLILIHSLQAKGIHKIGDFNLDEFERQASSVPFHPRAEAPPSVLAGSRSSAFFVTKNPPQIYVLTEQPESDLAAMPQLEVHELMGALKKGDVDTAKSTALATLDQTEDPEERARLIKLYAATIFAKGKSSDALAAGGFSVGGGGDLTMIHVKNEVYRYVRERAGRNFTSSEFSRHFLLVNFEPLKKGNRVVMNYQFRRYPVMELLSVYVPVREWEKGENAQGALVKEIATKLLAIFPLSDDPLVDFTPSTCRHGESIRFPRASDKDVAAIQDTRGRFLLNCRMVKEESGGVSTVGVTKDYVPPKSAGFFDYDCSVAATGQKSFHLSYSSMMGLSATSTKSGTVFNVNTDFLLFTDEKGKIQGAEIYYQEDGAKPRQITQAASTPTKVAVTLAVPRGKISFSCVQKED